MQQKVVMKVSMNGEKCRSKAMRVAVGIPGVVSAAFQGDDKDQIVVTGEIDSIKLTTLIRKRIGYAELISVGPVEEKKEEKKSEPEVQQMIWAAPQVGVPQYFSYEVPQPNHESCTIM